ncbi:MAG: TatD family hydrolase [Puniceicoccales bacterium]|jgi:TatD DNase family protein|nr:TatD family hydrolase [Puniceicoccales bacterium]
MDSHAHIDKFPENERNAVIERAWAAGLKRIVSVATSLGDSETLASLAKKSDGRIFCTVGVHPTELDSGVPAAKELEAAADSAKPIAIGETGIDLFFAPDGSGAARTMVERQRRAFFLQCCVAKEMSLPVIIHCREKKRGEMEAWSLTQKVLETAKFPVERALLHCFDYGVEELLRWQKAGGTLSFSGLLTRVDRGDLREAAKFAEVNKVLLETDSPFLLPEPLRGEGKETRCEPAHMVHTADCLANAFGYERESVLELSLKNGNAFFGLWG